MPSGKRARQQRQAAATAVRTPPPVRSKGVGGVRARQASPRALAIGGGVVLIAIIAVVLAVVLSGGSGGGSGVVTKGDLAGLPSVGNQNWPGALQGAGEANDLFKGIPQHGLTLGNPNAPVTMVMFIDVQCPFCQDYETTKLPTVVTKYIAKGKVQLQLKPWAFLGGQGSQSFSGRLGLIAASFQNKAFEYAKVLYDNQGTEETGWLTGKMMANIAASVTGLDLSKWQADTNSSTPKSIASRVDSLATQMKVGGTPTIFVGHKGRKLTSVAPPAQEPTLQETEQAINQVLSGT